MVKQLVHCGGSFDDLCTSYVGGDVTDCGEIDLDVLFVVDLASEVKELGYRNKIQFYYKLDEENLKEGMIELTTDRDIIRMIGRIIEENRKVIHMYVDHKVDEPAINEQPTIALLMDVPVEVEVLDYG
jgi:hypothetical protein